MSDPENPLEGIVNLPPEVTELPQVIAAEAPIITPFSAEWPARTWVPAERVTAGMMNGMRDQLNELYSWGQWTSYTPTTATTPAASAAITGIEANYMVFNKTLFLIITLTANITAAMTELHISLPAGFTVKSGGANRASNPFNVYPVGGAWVTGLGYALANDSVYRYHMVQGFPVTNPVYMWGTAILPIN